MLRVMQMDDPSLVKVHLIEYTIKGFYLNETNTPT